MLQVCELADIVCNGRLVCVHEGGYSEVAVPFAGVRGMTFMTLVLYVLDGWFVYTIFRSSCAVCWCARYDFLNILLISKCIYSLGSWFCYRVSYFFFIYIYMMSCLLPVIEQMCGVVANVMDPYDTEIAELPYQVCHTNCTLKRVMWYFEEGDVVLWRGWCGTLKRVVWYFEEGDVVLWRGWCGTLKRVMWYFEEGNVVLWRWYTTLNTVLYINVRDIIVYWCIFYVEPLFMPFFSLRIFAQVSYFQPSPKFTPKH